MSTARDRDGDPPPAARAPIVVVDDHELFATSVVLALRDARLPATALPVRHIADLLDSTIDCPNDPDTPASAGLVLLDLDLGKTSGTRLRGADFISRLHDRGWHVLVITGSEDDTHVAAAIAGGALGVIDKTDDFDQLLAAVRTAATGQSLITAAERDKWIALDQRYSADRQERTERLSSLTPREREVLDLMADGHRAAEIARHFVVSVATVRAQIRSILAKTKGCGSPEVTLRACSPVQAWSA
jgi:DNA-binding NarL/FixJ family response regulator